jgi:hypothetical protein
VPATRVLSDAIEALAACRPEPRTVRPGMVGRLGLAGLTAMERSPSWRRFLLNEREMQSKRRRAEEEHREVSWI